MIIVLCPCIEATDFKKFKSSSSHGPCLRLCGVLSHLMTALAAKPAWVGLRHGTCCLIMLRLVTGLRVNIKSLFALDCRCTPEALPGGKLCAVC